MNRPVMSKFSVFSCRIDLKQKYICWFPKSQITCQEIDIYAVITYDL